MADDKELESLNDGLASPFWQWFKDRATKEWGPSGLRYQQAVLDASQSQNAVVELQKVIHTQQAIWTLIKAPEDRLQQLRQQRKVDLSLVAPSRRGPGL